ncbi:MAG: hypothetical protein V1708_01285 [Candidatus Micrarchaeota archaeon]
MAEAWTGGMASNSWKRVVHSEGYGMPLVWAQAALECLPWRVNSEEIVMPQGQVPTASEFPAWFSVSNVNNVNLHCLQLTFKIWFHDGEEYL